MKVFGFRKKSRMRGDEVEEMVRKQTKLMEIAARDRVYKVWLGAFAEAKEEFTIYMDQQPPEVQQILCAALGTCEMLNQRLIDLACMNMEFTDPKNRE